MREQPPSPTTTMRNRLLFLMFVSIATMLFSLSYFHTLEVSSLHHQPQQQQLHPSEVFSKKNETTEHYCSSFWTRAWLDGDRLGNAEDPRMAQTIVDVASLFQSHTDDATVPHLLQQTLCHPDSTFLSLNSNDNDNSSNATVHAWSVKLLYLAVHLHQHLPAVEEARWRRRRQPSQTRSCQSAWAQNNVGAFDYECPSAKFLVVSMGRLGLGAVMRLGVVNALIAGVASNRIVLVVNHAPVGPKFLQEPWLLASCPRRDMQCFYMPLTPCVVTTQELQAAPTLERGQARALFRTGQLPQPLAEERVVVMDLVLRPQRTPRAFRERTVQLLHDHILQPLQQQQQQQQQQEPHPLLPLLTQATHSILQEEQLDNGSYYYFGHNSRHNHALVYYAMRPNLEYSQRLDEIRRHMIPPDLQPDRTFGVPIRDSDKCDLESECLPFAQYMNMTCHTWFQHREAWREEPNKTSTGRTQWDGAPNTAHIIVTSESALVHTAMEQYQQEGHHRRDFPFDARLVSNPYDVHPGTGNPGRTTMNVTMDEVMLSAVSSLQAQLHARYTFGNCCSNFHLLLLDFLRDGCGAAPTPVAECMQDHIDPAFRLCCHWSKTEECQAKRLRSN